MPYFPRDFEAPERRAELMRWLRDLRGPARPKPPVLTAHDAAVRLQASEATKRALATGDYGYPLRILGLRW